MGAAPRGQMCSHALPTLLPTLLSETNTLGCFPKVLAWLHRYCGAQAGTGASSLCVVLRKARHRKITGHHQNKPTALPKPHGSCAMVPWRHFMMLLWRQFLLFNSYQCCALHCELAIIHFFKEQLDPQGAMCCYAGGYWYYYLVF